MLNHVMVGSDDIDKSKRFYDAVLGLLGAGAPKEHKNDTGQARLFYIHDGSTFCVTEPIDGHEVSNANGSTIGFVCHSPEQVVELHDIALANGGTSVEDPPGQRVGSLGTMHLCYFLDPDGHKICGIYRTDQ